MIVEMFVGLIENIKGFSSVVQSLQSLSSVVSECQISGSLEEVRC